MLSKPSKCIHNSMVTQLQRLPFLLQHNQKRRNFNLPSVESSVRVHVCCHLLARKQIMCFKNLPLNFFFAETTILRLKVNCKTSFVVILNGICVPALNIRVNTLRENYSCNYKH